MKHIIAVDFDGILAQTDVPFPQIGTPNYQMISFVSELIEEHEVILWTSRTGKALDDALKWCEEHGLKFKTINDQAPSNKARYLFAYPQGTRKVSADLYIDDHEPNFILEKHRYGDFEAIRSQIRKIKEIMKLWEKEN